jgi:hypothetical protein
MLSAQNTAEGDGIIESGENPQEELAKAAQNPVADLISLPFQLPFLFPKTMSAKALQ